MNNLDIILLMIFGLIVVIYIYNTFNHGKGEDFESKPILVRTNCHNCNKNKFLEHYENIYDDEFFPDYAWLSRNNLLPWWNSTRHTKNSSWDLRGDVPIPYTYVGPWLNSPLV